MVTWQDIQDALKQSRRIVTIAEALIAWGLTPDLATFIAVALIVCELKGYRFPLLTSGYRTPQRQRELLNNWIAGNRRGLVARPAERSWHMQGRAVDVSRLERTESFRIFRDAMVLMGVEWGGNFRKPDPVHFQVPKGKLLSINQLLATG